MVLLASLRDRLFSLSSRNLSIFIRVWIVSLDTDVLNCRRSKFISSTQDNFRNTFSCCQDVYYIMDLTVSSKRAVVKAFLRVHKQWKYWVLINCWSTLLEVTLLIMFRHTHYYHCLCTLKNDFTTALFAIVGHSEAISKQCLSFSCVQIS